MTEKCLVNTDGKCSSIPFVVKSGDCLSLSAFKILFVRASTIQHNQDPLVKAAFVKSMPGFVISGTSTPDFEV